MQKPTPSEVMFDELRRIAEINNRDAAYLLLSSESVDGKTAPRLRVTEKTFLSRNIVHVAPGGGRIKPEMYADFCRSVMKLAPLVIEGAKHLHPTVENLLAHFEQTSIKRMIAALDAWERHGSLLRNSIERIDAKNTLKPRDRFTLALLAFIVCGCLADSSAAAQEVRTYARRRLACTFSTLTTSVEKRPATPPVDDRTCNRRSMGLLRLALDGGALPPIEPLNPLAGGTLIGSDPHCEHAITNVGLDVSHEHLKLEFDGVRWSATGLESTNGSVVYRADGRIDVIEPPRGEREGGTEGEAITVGSGDVLQLGASTRFLLIALSSSVCELV